MSKNRKGKILSSTVDKLVMGAIIGGAVGSVIGVKLHHKNKSGENAEVQKSPKKKKKSLLKVIFKHLVKKASKKKQADPYKEIPHESIEFTIEEEDRELWK